ncbi:MAG: high-affinity nickel-transport family protein [bacterium]
MATLLSIIFLGFFLGMRHATDADHVIAVTTIVSRQRTIRGAALIGILWGLGHTLTIILVGGAMIIFSVVISPRLGLSLELGVALMLIILGFLNLKGITRWISETFSASQGRKSEIHHAHPHSHGDYVHSHVHSHNPEEHGHREDETPQGWLDRTFGKLGIYQVIRPIIIGVVHGLAGSAALALLVLPVIHDPLWAIAYLLVFGLGTIAGMALITTAIALPFAYTANWSVKINRYLGVASGLLSLGFGLFLVYQIGFVEGLFK